MNTPHKPSNQDQPSSANKSGPILELGRARQQQLKADRPRSRLPLTLFVLGSLALLIGVPVYLLRPQDTLFKVQTYTAAPVTRATILSLTSATGRVVPERVISFTAPADGTLSTLEAVAGDTVKPGALLAQIRSRTLEGGVEKAQAALSEAQDAVTGAKLTAQASTSEKAATLRDLESKLAPLEKSLKTSRELYAAGGVARAEVSKLETDLQGARAARDNALSALNAARELGSAGVAALERKRETARGQLKDAQTQAAATVLKSTLEGQILEVKVNAGDTVKAGDLLFTVADTRRMRVDASVDEAAAAQVQVGQKVSVQMGEATYPGEVAQVAPQAVAGSGGAGGAAGSSVPVRVRFVGTVPRLRPNISASVDITTGVQKDVPTLPRAPFLTSGGERLVYVVMGPDRAERREVVFGASSAERVQVVSGLKVGERVLTSSMEAYKDQPRVQLAPGGELRDAQEAPNG